ncbi:odorant receptor 30a-like isoform X2 [Cylas formicarius]|uniref:odorant receptor 30a-like isoform X2 n=1 Tax=Cylas formicarius TaxID=197179 RepID=UPI002958D818|nr:odorant receptor 30a-like isoform X2 [Cylas formicarius]XP_060533387.1 odorant receptor 30a-like isoform X2 [Cylas formicarius]
MNHARPHQSILNFSKRFMMTSGIWRLPTINCPTIAKIYAVYSTTIQTFYSIVAVSFGIQFASTFIDKFAKNSEAVFKEASYIITLVIIEYASIVCQRKNMRNIMTFILHEEHHIFENEDEDVRKTYLGHLKFCWKSNAVLFAFTCCSGAAIVLENLVLQLEVHKLNRELNETRPKPLPLDLYYWQFDPDKYDTFLLIVHDVWLTNTMFLIVSTKTIVFTCIIFAPSIMTRLQMKLNTLKEGEVWSSVKKLAREHQKIIEFVEQLNDSIKYLILLEYLLNSLNVATISVQFITDDKKMIAGLVFYLSFLFVQTFILGWSANEIKLQSTALSDAMYQTSWYNQSRYIQKMLLTMMVQSQKPLAVTVGPFEAMTTQSALTVMKASYSYVTLMMNNYDKRYQL